MPSPEQALPLQALRAAREQLGDAARAGAVEGQHALGKLSARERIALLVDHGSFHEIGALVQPKPDTFDTEHLQAPADAVLAGYATLDGRAIGLCAFDFTVLGGSNGRIGEHKVERVALHALEHGCPLVLLLDGGGHRIQEGLDSRHFAVGSHFFQTAVALSGWVPTVALIMGPGFAGPSNFAALCDFVVMVRDTSTMGIAGPALVAAMDLPRAQGWALRGKTAATTGAASGFGRELALLCASEGMRLARAYLDLAGLEQPLALTGLGPDEALVQRCDVSKPKDVERRLRDFLAGGAPNNPLQGLS